eukprot:COSAG01_NODE_28542_length_658_cov_2.955277_1_plen_75_part_10
MRRGGGKGHRLVVHDRHDVTAPPRALSRRRPRQPAHTRRPAHLQLVAQMYGTVDVEELVDGYYDLQVWLGLVLMF